MPQFLDHADANFEARFGALLNAKREDSPDVDDAVATIIADVRNRGDAAVIELTERFDRIVLTPATLRISSQEVAVAMSQVDPADRAALELAAERIRAYHARQMPADARWTQVVSWPYPHEPVYAALAEGRWQDGRRRPAPPKRRSRRHALTATRWI